MMNSRSSSFSVPAPRLQQRPSFSSRLSFAISNAEQGEAATAPTNAEHQIDEEIEKIKRYEVRAQMDTPSPYVFTNLIGQDFTTIGIYHIPADATCQPDGRYQIGCKMLLKNNYGGRFDEKKPRASSREVDVRDGDTSFGNPTMRHKVGS